MSWTAPTETGGADITGYRIEVSEDDATWRELVADTESTATTYTDNYSESDQTPEAVRHYRVSAINAAGAGPASGSNDAEMVPLAPTDVEVVPGNGKLGVSWTGSPGADGYNMYWDTVPPSTTQTTNDVTSPQIITGVTNGQTYSVWVGAKNEATLISGNLHNQVNSDRVSATPMAEVPGKPTNMTAGPLPQPDPPQETSSISLGWSAPADDGGSAITGYRIEVSENGYDWRELVGNTDSTDTNYTHSGLPGGVTRHYRVSAINAVGAGESSDRTVSDSATTVAALPAPPTMLEATPGNETVSLTWTASAHDGGSAIARHQYRRQAGNAAFEGWTNIADSAPSQVNATSFTVIGLNNGTEYTFEVRAVNAVGASASDRASATPVEGRPPSAPRNLTAYPGEDEVLLRWEASEDDGGWAVTHHRVTVRGVFAQGSRKERSYWTRNAREYRVRQLSGGVEYVFQVRAMNDVGEGPPSPELRVTTLERPEGAPSSPSRLTVTPDGGDRVRLAWQAPGDHGDSPLWGYRIEACEAGCAAEADWYPVVANTGSTRTDYLHEGVAGLAELRYRVAAINTGAGAGNPTSPVARPPMRLDGFRLWPGARKIRVNLNVEDADGSELLLLVHRDGAPDEERRVERVRLLESRNHWGHGIYGLEPETTYRVTMDFVEGFDSPRARTAVATTKSAAHIDDWVPSWTQPSIEISTDGGANWSERGASLGGIRMGGEKTYLVRLKPCHDQTRAVQVRDIGGTSSGMGASPMAAVGTWTTLTCAGDAPSAAAEVTMRATAIGDYPADFRGTALTRTPLELVFGHAVSAADPNASYEISKAYVTTLGVTLLPPAEVLAAPTGVGLETVDDDTVRPVWDAVTGAEGYQVQWRVGGGSGGGYDRTRLVTGNALLDIEADRETAVYLRVRAWSATAIGAWAEAVRTGLPGAVGALEAEPQPGGTSVRLAWQAPRNDGGSALTGYRIEVSADNGGSWSDLVADTRSTATEYRHTGLAPGSVRFYRVRALNAAGAGPATTIASTSAVQAVLSVADARVDESGDGTETAMTFTVRLEPAASGTVTVRYATETADDDEAVAGADYEAASDTLTFAPGETVKTFDVTVLDDTEKDSGETFTVVLSEVTGNAVLGRAQAKGTIRNDETSPVTGFTLVDAAGGAPNEDLQAIAENAAVDLAGQTTTWYAIRADVAADEEVGSVRLEVTGPGGKRLAVTDNTAPYSVRSDNGNGDYYGFNLPNGEYTVTATPYPEDDAGGTALAGLTRTFTVTGSHAHDAAPVTGLVLVDAEGDAPDADIGAVEDEGTVNLAGRTSTSFTFRAELAEDAPVGSVRLELSGPDDLSVTRLENADGSPVSLHGDTPPQEDDGAHDYAGAALPDGEYTLTATPYVEPEGRGDALTALSLSFTVTREEAPAVETKAPEITSLGPFTVDEGGTAVATLEASDADTPAADLVWSIAGGDDAARFTLSEAGVLAFKAAPDYDAPDDADADRSYAVTVQVSDGNDSATADLVVRVRERVAGLTASFVGMPREHDGESVFTFRLSFSEDPALSYKVLRDESFTVTGGAVRKARRVDGREDLREIHVEPSGHGDVTLKLRGGRACGTYGAICTSDGKVLANTLTATVEGPAALSVADASVEEAPGAVLDFAVTLDRAAYGTVTVDYETADGTATAGDDYTETSGTLTFLAGETEKTVSVPVIDDSHDEGEETMTLRLSNPSGARIADGEAVGTISNSDAIPKAWLARFGRTVAEQVFEAVEGRFSAPRAAGVEMTLAGERIGSAGAASEDPGTGFGGRDRSGSGAGAEARTALAGEHEARSRLEAMTQWLRGQEAQDDTEGGRAGYRSRAVTPRDLLTGSSFALTGEAKAGGTVSLWGRGAVSRFDGREGDLTLDGEVASAMLGADWARDRWTAGLLVSRSVGEGGYRGASAATVESTLTGFFPYGRYAASDRVTLWGVAGYGAGELTLTPEGQAAMRTDMDLVMGAVGARSVAVEAAPEGGLELAVKTDAMAVRTSSEKVAGMEAAEADATRLRLGLEGAWRRLKAGTGELTPRVEIGLRHDGGDAETGFGLDLGGGLAWSDPESGLSAEIRGRGLLTHESRGFRDRGLSGSFAWDPGRGSGRGPKLMLTQTVGASASGGVDALLGQRHLAGLAANDNGDELANRRLELRLGYGFPAFGDRFTSTPELGLGLSNGRRDYRLGWRLGLERGGPSSLEVRLEVTRSEAAGANDNTDTLHGVGFRVTARW